MPYLCPVCNGLASIQYSCEHCGTPALDQGRLTDYDDPYSPYRPIEDMRATMGYESGSGHTCIHLVYCPDCQTTYALGVEEAFS